MPRGAAAAPKKRAGPKATKLAEEFTKGTVMTDVLKKQWRLGEVIGHGGFGLLYHANSTDSSTSSESQFVVKVEPGANGPLFCEMNFYIRAAKKEYIQDFIKCHKLKYLAVPPYVGSGLHTYNSVSYRFLVMPRYGTDLQKLLQAAGGIFPTTTIFAIGIRMLDALQYLHQKEYVHADVKASNILFGFNGRSEDRNQVYLADYGLAYRYTANDEHKAYKEDPRNAHNGTIEFTSRDAHKGVFPSRRGDLEILGFCLLQWMCGKLPWEDNLTNAVYVASKKEECMKDVRSFVQTSLLGPSNSSSECILQYLQEVIKLNYQEEPKYKKFKDILKLGLSKAGQKDEWKIGFPTESKTQKRKSQDSTAPSPKKRTVADKKEMEALPVPVVSPFKKRGRPPKKSPLVNGKTSSTLSPLAKAVATVRPLRASPAKTTWPRKKFDTTKPKKTFQMPVPSNTSSPGTPTDNPKRKTPTKYIRRVRKADVSRTDASIQTTPGLKSNF